MISILGLNEKTSHVGRTSRGNFWQVSIPTPWFVPIVIAFEFESALECNVNLGGQISASYSPELAFVAGYEYLNNGNGRGSYVA
jgi:hypothetical protein